MPDTIDWPLKSERPPRDPSKPRIVLLLFAVVAVALFSSRTALSYYVDGLWFASLGYGSVFRTTLSLQWSVFAVSTALTFAVLYGWFLILRRVYRSEMPDDKTIFINGRPIRLPLGSVLRWIALGLALVISLVTGLGIMGQWQTLALYWFAPPTSAGPSDPIFALPLNFYLFTLPAWQILTGWLLTVGVISCFVSIFFVLVTGSARLIQGRNGRQIPLAWRGFSVSFAFLLLVLAMRTYIGRFDRLFEDHTIFGGVTYTDAHVTLAGMLLVCIAFIVGAIMVSVNLISPPRVRWLALSVLPAIVIYFGVQLVGWYVASFIVKPNELVREQPYIANNIDATRAAYGLDKMTQKEFPAETTVEAADAADNQATLQDIRLWDWRALQDTLRQIQEIRTYYDFPGIDIDRYQIDGQTRQVMLAARELSVEKLPESSRNWINEKLIYTHGYGITMNPVNGFTTEGLPTLLLSNMPIQSTTKSISVTRPEIYFGELTDTDIYVKTRQQEFNYPQGATNNLTSYQGEGGILLGGFFRRLLIAFDRGDLTKLPFSDDINAESRLLMRRNLRDRVAALAPFLTFDSDPYIVVGDDGRLSWMLDAFTTSDSYPYSSHYALGDNSINYLRNSVKITVDAYTGAATFYAFDTQDPILQAYRRIFPSLFQDASAMPADLRRHVRYPEMLLKQQAQVYGLYHMTDPQVFYNREDLWTVASELGTADSGEQKTLAMDPNYVLMKLPGENKSEFVGILPFTPANRNNLIGWIATRSDGPNYGTAVVYNFPKTRLVDGPMQIEARIDQNAQLSGQLTLWNQQGSHVRRGALLVIPCGKALLYAEPIYLQADRSPMPELRLVVLALQDRLAYGPTFESALRTLFGGGTSSLTAEPGAAEAANTPAAPGAAPKPLGSPTQDLNTQIAEAAKDLADYQRLTAEGKLGEAGQKLEELKHKLEQLNARPK